MKKLFAVVSALAAASSALAGDVTDLAWTTENGKATITYNFSGAAALVTADILTNGVSVTSLGTLSGDVNKMVDAGAKSIVFTMDDAGLAQSRAPEGAWSVKVNVVDPRHKPDYMVIEIATGATAFYPDAASIPDGVSAAKYKETHIILRRIPAANTTAFLGLGRLETNRGYFYPAQNEIPFDEDYYMAIYELTVGQYNASGLSYDLGEFEPTYYRNHFAASLHTPDDHDLDWKWHPATVAAETLQDSILSPLQTKFRAATGLNYTFCIPNEYEWEFACRANTTSDLYTPGRYDAQCWKVGSIYVNFQAMEAFYGTNGSPRDKHPGYSDPMPVGMKLANGWGLYDMLGNLGDVVTQYGGSGYYLAGGQHPMSGESMTCACRETGSTGGGRVCVRIAQ